MAAPFLEAARYRACASRRACIRSAHQLIARWPPLEYGGRRQVVRMQAPPASFASVLSIGIFRLPGRPEEPADCRPAQGRLETRLSRATPAVRRAMRRSAYLRGDSQLPKAGLHMDLIRLGSPGDSRILRSEIRAAG